MTQPTEETIEMGNVKAPDHGLKAEGDSRMTFSGSVQFNNVLIFPKHLEVDLDTGALTVLSDPDTAAAEFWRVVTESNPLPDVEALIAENERLQIEVRRVSIFAEVLSTYLPASAGIEAAIRAIELASLEERSAQQPSKGESE